MKKIMVFALVLLLSVSMLAGCGDSGPDLTQVKSKYNEVVAIYNQSGDVLLANGWDKDEVSLTMHNDIGAAIDDIKKVIEDPKLSKEIDPDAMVKDLDELIVILKEYTEAIDVPFPSVDLSSNELAYASDEQTQEMIGMLVEIFNAVNTDFNLLVEYLDENELVTEGSELLSDLQTFSDIIHEVRDLLTAETISAAAAEYSLDMLLAVDEFIVATIDMYIN